MPRRARMTTPETLERQLAADSQLAVENDEPWRDQTIPTFDDAPPGRSREEVLADLDERADRLNGHSDVRPSERCPAMAPESSSLKGMRCTFHQEHDGRHSWQPTQEQAPDLIEPAQSELPGTPEPPAKEPYPTVYSIPYEAQFQKRDYQVADGIELISNRLIADTPEFAHLRGVRIRYYWKRRGGLKGGNPRLGNLQKAGGIGAFEAGQPTYFLWLGADHCRDWKPTETQLDALIFTQLCKAAVDPDDHDAYRVLGPDFEGFTLAVRRYGLDWHPDLRELGANVKQLDLLDGLEIPDADDDDQDDGDSDGDEGEESE